MLIIVTKNYNELSKRAAELVADDILKKPNMVLGLPTGETPVGMYKLLVKNYKNKKINFSKITCFNLDEYYPIKKENKNSYYSYMHKNFFDSVNVKSSNINILDSESKTPKKDCLAYEKKIKKTPLDLQILGVGINGHIGFNEPGSKKSSKTRVIDLTLDTRKRNSRFFKNKSEVPTHALSMGISTILGAKKLILLANGKNKAEAIKHLVEGKPSCDWPVSFLRAHKNLVVILDKEAAGLLF
ncbi:MAG: glucosamine-6-phosphate deaminase [Candidatus Pacearchaeota archaeon]|jgi:glucosamine-6-phosphate deaminase